MQKRGVVIFIDSQRWLKIPQDPLFVVVANKFAGTKETRLGVVGA